MEDMTRKLLSGSGIPVRGNDIDTDRIIPARFLKTVTFEGLGDHAFEDDRLGLKERGEIHSYDKPEYASAQILFTNKNFGCGSSREHAPQAIMRWGKGIKAIIGESFAEIFYGNCISLGIPCPTVSSGDIEKLMSAVEADPAAEVNVDVESRTISIGSLKVNFEMPDGPRQQFLTGAWDSTATLLVNKSKIEETAKQLPYVSDYVS